MSTDDTPGETTSQVDLPTFYVVAPCSSCDEDIFYGPCATLLTHRGLPVVPFDIASQTSFHCTACGASNYTGDVDLYCEDYEMAGDNDPDVSPDPEGAVATEVAPDSDTARETQVDAARLLGRHLSAYRRHRPDTTAEGTS